MKHIWVQKKKRVIDTDLSNLMCARCGMDKGEWEIIGKPPCKEKLPIPEEHDYGYATT